MKYKVAELEGAPLDAAVALAEGLRLVTASSGRSVAVAVDGTAFEPSLCWEHGGPIIERERIHIGHGWLRNPDLWAAAIGYGFGDEVWRSDQIGGTGPTPLIAAMRAYVASKLGDEIGLP